MTTATSTAEYIRVRELAEEYEQRGYDVSTEAPLDFVEGVRADLLARKGGETRVIMVRSRSSLAAEPRLADLARLIAVKPGWSFRLMLLAEPESLSAPADASLLDIDAGRQRLDEAEQMLALGHAEAALMLAWSVCEAALRHLIASRGVSDSRITTLHYTLEQAANLEVISDGDYERLSDLRKLRNAIVHGFLHDDLSVEPVRELVALGRTLLDPARKD